MIKTILAFLVAIMLLVSLHELGHLVVARLCNIKVLRFSVGFGTPFFTKRWRNIDWCIAPIPLGGYVKMVDTREGKVAEEDLPFAFDKQHPLKRIAVVVAGPLTNLILAVALYVGSFSLGGVTEILPLVGSIQPQSIASKAGFEVGDKILSINGKPINNMMDAQTDIILNLEAGQITVDVETANGTKTQRIINAVGTPEATLVAKQQAGLGFSAFKPSEKIGMVQPNSPAEKAGLQKGDQIIAINGQKTPKWTDWSVLVRENAGRNLKVTYTRNGKTLETVLRPDSVELPDRSQIIGRAGLVAGVDEVWEQKIRHHYYPTFGQSVELAWGKMVHYTELTFGFFGKILVGNASLNHISGPVTIADVAGQTIRIGWQPYVEFMALVSISLGAMNLLPIPVLDGGHLLFYTIELIRGKPLSQRIQDLGLRFGMSVMLLMMILAFYNDISRLLG